MAEDIMNPAPAGDQSPFEQIKRVNADGNEHWSSRDFARVLGYGDYRNFEQVIAKAKIACFNSGQRLEDHFVDITELIEIKQFAWRPKGSRNTVGYCRPTVDATLVLIPARSLPFGRLPGQEGSR